ncbi:hypothetical protein C8R32_109100 [Nitrosospira sp. Nsp5]|uniref:Uncharacterized protein n=1 Tax=Nitrosospira multiformis TaxID=1231 RepID=A0ABY0TKK1_9PROT|nr:hypothetical protein C8R32_109100 [Nitrosospira sp. Nsp5]SDQ88929.1 hypothetical protein SAMN05216402_2699 [Nitrosospira multiformis]
MTIRTIYFLLAYSWSVGICAQDLPAATFDLPAFHNTDNNACDARTTKTQLSPDSRELSMIFPGCFLELGQNVAEKSRASCKFDLVFSKKLEKLETVRIDIRGSELKDTAVQLRYMISLGGQTHNFEYEKGRIIQSNDPAHSDFIRSFELTDIPAGARKIRLSFEGKGKSDHKASSSYIAIDTLDACIVDPGDEDQLECGDAAKRAKQNKCLKPE